MIKQVKVTVKTAGAALEYGEMGDVVANTNNECIITLPSPNDGLWYRISNVGEGLVRINYGSDLASLKKEEQCLCLANGSSGWFVSKGGGGMTKAEIEEVLTGEISTHTHESLYELPAGGTADQVLAKVDGVDRNVEWVNAPPAINGIPIGGTANQLFAKNSNVDYDGKWVDAPEASNGLPSGGTASQILKKVDGSDYNAQWIDPPEMDAVKILAKPVNISDFTGKDDYVLAYDETNGEFYLKLSSGGGGGFILGAYPVMGLSEISVIAASNIPFI